MVMDPMTATRWLLFIGSLTLGPLSAADPAWESELSAAAPGDFPPVPAGVLDLQLSWKGMINSGYLRLDFAAPDATKPGVRVVRSSAASVGIAAGLYPYQSTFWSEIDSSSLKPRLFHAVDSDGRETVTSTSRFLAGRVEFEEITRNLRSRAESQRQETFKFAPVFDIFSAMLWVRSQKLAVGDQINLVLNPFGTPYLLRVTVVQREIHLERKTIRLSVGMQKIHPRTLELRPYKKMKQAATLWLTDDAARIPLELRAPVFIGDVRATLTRFRQLP